jgi:hypothetical protein
MEFTKQSRKVVNSVKDEDFLAFQFSKRVNAKKTRIPNANIFYNRSALKSQELRLKGIRAEIEGAKNEIIALQVRRLEQPHAFFRAYPVF